jgi:hypothetical protein
MNHLKPLWLRPQGCSVTSLGVQASKKDLPRPRRDKSNESNQGTILFRLNLA